MEDNSHFQSCTEVRKHLAKNGVSGFKNQMLQKKYKK